MLEDSIGDPIEGRSNFLIFDILKSSKSAHVHVIPRNMFSSFDERIVQIGRCVLNNLKKIRNRADDSTKGVTIPFGY